MDIAELEQLPRRQLLGSDAYALVRNALTQRLEDVESQRGIDLITDASDYHPAVRASRYPRDARTGGGGG